MLISEDRHEPVTAQPWDESRAREAVQRIVEDTERHFSPLTLWPMHPLDSKDPSPSYPLYMGACGVIWALRYLQAQGAASLSRVYNPFVLSLLGPNRGAPARTSSSPFASYMKASPATRPLRY